MNHRRAAGELIPPLLDAQYKLVKKLVLDKLKPALGLGRARFCVSGAAPIAADVLEFFASLDILIYEVYGQSEDSGPTTLNVPGRTLLGSVGPALPGVQVKIADDGEILVKGPNVFLGYYKDPAGHRRQPGRRLAPLRRPRPDRPAAGSCRSPAARRTSSSPPAARTSRPRTSRPRSSSRALVSEAVVIGDRRKFLSALITLDPEAATRLLPGGNGAAAHAHESPVIRAELQRVIDDVNKTLARVEQIKKFTVLPRQFGIDTGELTPTLKVKRKIVNQNFAREIEAMYGEAAAPREARAPSGPGRPAAPRPLLT